MKKNLILLIALLFGLALVSCDDSTTDPIVEEEFGNLQINSTPSGASITLDGVATGNVTPFLYAATDIGEYTVTLSLEGYYDTTYVVTVTKDETTTIDAELMAETVYFSTPVKIWETTGTTADQPSGLVLSSGAAQSSTTSDIDIYYYSSSDGSTFLVQSAHNSSGSSRETFFNVGSGTDLNDGVDSEEKDGNWTDNMSDREENYVFLLDADGNYSKLKITSFGGGTGPGDPSWVEVSWIYNPVVGSTMF